jgi:hypothetical protein
MVVTGHGARAAEVVVQLKPGSDVEPLPEPPSQWIDEADWGDEMWCDAMEQELALPQCLPDETDLELLEVAHSSVDELARSARRARSDVAGFDQAHGKAPCSGVERHTAADHASPDDQDVKLMSGEVPKCRLARGRR